MKNLCKRGLMAVSLLIAIAFSLTGCTDDAGDRSFGWTFNWTFDIGWVGTLIGIAVLAAIGFIVYIIAKASKKNDKK